MNTHKKNFSISVGIVSELHRNILIKYSDVIGYDIFNNENKNKYIRTF